MAEDQDWDKALAEGPGPVAVDTAQPRYCYATFMGRRLVDNREGLTWPSVCGVIGNSAESDDFDTLIVRRQSDEVIVLRYSRSGFKR